MSLLSKLERTIGRWAIPNLSLYLVLFQGLSFIVIMSKPEFYGRLLLDPQLVLQGQWWRLLMFMFIPPDTSVLFIIFALYLFYLMGTALEQTWGTFRYNAYILIAWLMTAATSFLPLMFGLPSSASTNGYIASSVFLAFAFLFPDFVLYIFFILPVKVKWLALITWIFYGYMLIDGNWMERAAILASIVNFLIFFSADIVRIITHRSRRTTQKIKQMQENAKADEAFHRCTTCGRTDKTNPELEFRYCPLCGGKGYCMDHIASHQHVR